MERDYDTFVTCRECQEHQLTRLDNCRKCGAKLDFNIRENVKGALPKEMPPPPEPKIKEISCVKCRSLWIGVGIAGVIFSIVMNFFYNIFDLNEYQIYDVLRYTGATIGLSFFAYATYHCMKSYCNGGSMLLGEIGGDKGNKWVLTLGLLCAIIFLTGLTLTIDSLEISLFFYTNFNEFYQNTTSESDEIVEQIMLNSDCRHIKELADREHGNKLRIEYYDISILYFANIYEDDENGMAKKTEMGTKYFNCWDK